MSDKLNPEHNLFQLTIQHVPTNAVVSFPAYLENLSDLYSSTWQAEDVYGRMDPITTFVNTRRAISVAWNVPAESFKDAKDNLRKINKLMTFLYPLYSNGKGGATAINQGPLVRIQFGNLICRPDGSGLLGYLNGFTFDPRIENGMFYGKADAGGPSAEYYPKTILLNTEMNVLHEHELGFKKEGNNFIFRNSKLNEDENSINNNSKFPYVVTKGSGRETSPRDPRPDAIDFSRSGITNAQGQLIVNPNADVAANGPNRPTFDAGYQAGLAYGIQLRDRQRVNNED